MFKLQETKSAETSAERYQDRLAAWGSSGKNFPALRHGFWWLVHNTLAHPFLGVWPSRQSVRLHDWTSKKLNHRESAEASPLPVIPSRLRWMVHNILAHTAIGWLPCRATFGWHDRTAKWMQVEGWV